MRRREENRARSVTSRALGSAYNARHESGSHFPAGNCGARRGGGACRLLYQSDYRTKPAHRPRFRRRSGPGLDEGLPADDGRPRQEAEADAVGIQLAAHAGYDPHAAVTLWDKMSKLADAGRMEFLSTHPSPENRAAKLKEFGAKLEPAYQAAKTNPPVAQRYVNLPVVRVGGSNERVVEPPLGANERIVRPAPTSSN